MLGQVAQTEVESLVHEKFHLYPYIPFLDGVLLENKTIEINVKVKKWLKHTEVCATVDFLLSS